MCNLMKGHNKLAMRFPVLTCVLAGFVTFAAPSAGVAGDLGSIALKLPAGDHVFILNDIYAASDSSWGGLNDLDRNFRLFGGHHEGASVFLSVEYEPDG